MIKSDSLGNDLNQFFQMAQSNLYGKNIALLIEYSIIKIKKSLSKCYLFEKLKNKFNGIKMLMFA
jgi:hypothetical protein